MDWIEHALPEQLPDGWEVSVERAGHQVTVQCRHVVLGGHEFHLDDPDDTPPDEAVEAHVAAILERLEELGLLEASQRMPTLSDAETETLREAHAVIGAARLSRRQARSVVGLSRSLAHLSDVAGDWAMETIDLLEPWHDYPPDPADGADGADAADGAVGTAG